MALEERVKPRLFGRVAACGGEIRGLRLSVLVERRAERVERVLGGAALGDQRGGCVWAVARPRHRREPRRGRGIVGEGRVASRRCRVRR